MFEFTELTLVGPGEVSFLPFLHSGVLDVKEVAIGAAAQHSAALKNRTRMIVGTPSADCRIEIGPDAVAQNAVAAPLNRKSHKLYAGKEVTIRIPEDHENWRVSVIQA